MLAWRRLPTDYSQGDGPGLGQAECQEPGQVGGGQGRGAGAALLARHHGQQGRGRVQHVVQDQEVGGKDPLDGQEPVSELVDTRHSGRRNQVLWLLTCAEKPQKKAYQKWHSVKAKFL
jgi:hypothetical protein